jgi:hypothetical protein
MPRNRRLWGAGVVSAVVLAAIVAAVAARSRSVGVAAAMAAAGCTYRDVAPYPPNDGVNYHNDVPQLSSRPRWTTFPPSAGAHYRLWATWGFYRRPVDPAKVVHNEEHGGVVIWWGPKVPAATVEKLAGFYRGQPVGVLGTPIAGLGSKIALTAWTADPAWKGEPGLAYFHHRYGMGHIAVCPQFDERAFAAFRRAYRGRSPQGFPLAEDRPGCGPLATCRVSR